MHRESNQRGSVRTALVALLACLALLGAPARADADRSLAGVPPGLVEQAASQNFVVHYTSAPGDPNAITADAAQRLIVTAERALGDSRSRLDLPPPMDDGDGRADVYVYAGTSRGPERGFVRADSRDDRASGWLAVPPEATGDLFAVTHLVVHLQQLALYRPAGRALAEGSATWAPLHLYANELRTLPDSAQFFADDPIDCDDPDRCGLPGYNAWRFFELLAERHGPQVVRTIYDRSRMLGARDHRPHLIEALSAVLAERGSTTAGDVRGVRRGQPGRRLRARGAGPAPLRGHGAVRRPGQRHAHAAVPPARRLARPPVVRLLSRPVRIGRGGHRAPALPARPAADPDRRARRPGDSRLLGAVPAPARAGPPADPGRVGPGAAGPALDDVQRSRDRDRAAQPEHGGRSPHVPAGGRAAAPVAGASEGRGQALELVDEPRRGGDQPVRAVLQVPHHAARLRDQQAARPPSPSGADRAPSSRRCARRPPRPGRSPRRPLGARRGPRAAPGGAPRPAGPGAPRRTRSRWRSGPARAARPRARGRARPFSVAPPPRSAANSSPRGASNTIPTRPPSASSSATLTAQAG